MQAAAAYIRVSTDDQLEYSPDSQLKKIKEYAKAHNILLAEEYIYREEEGRSGRKAEKRPEFLRMISDAKAKPKPFDVILVWKFSRFARNQEESIVYKSLLSKQCAIEVISISEPTIDGPFGTLIERIIEWMDEYYSIRLSGEVKRGMEESISRGKYVNGAAPFGYIKTAKGTLEPDPSAAEIVKMIYAHFLDGWTYSAITNKINNMGIKTTRGSSFELRHIKFILTNPVYMGMLRWGENDSHNWNRADRGVYQGQHQPIISEELWENAQTRMADIRKKYPKRQKYNAKDKFMLQGLLKCSACGGGFARAEQGRYLQCIHYAHKKCTVSHHVPQKEINSRVIGLIELEFSKGEIQLAPRKTEHAEEIKYIQTQIEAEKRKLKRIQQAYENEIDTLEEYKTKKERVLQNIAKWNKALNQQPASTMDPQTFINQHKSVLQYLKSPEIPEERKNDMLRGFVDKIVYNKPLNKLSIFFYY